MSSVVNKKIKIPGPLECIIYEGYVTTSDQVFDETANKTQDKINEQTADIDGRLAIVEQHETISMGGGDIQVGTASDMESSASASRAKVPTVGAIQDSLKTINNTSIIGEGNISIESGGEDNVIEVVEVNGTALEVTDKTVNIDLSGYQTALSSQTAYTEKGSSTKVPKITTNALGQVTAIEEVAISGGGGGGTQVQSDWEESDDTSDAYIKHKPTIPTVPTISTDISSDASSDAKTASPKAVKTFVEGKGYTTNTGTITSVKMNGSTVASSGEVDLGTVITSHQDITGKEDKLTIVSSPTISSNTLQAEISKYYVLTNVSTLTITLPTPTSGKVETIVFFVGTGSSFSQLSFPSTVYKQKDMPTLEASKYYEINALWNGTAWCIAQVELEAPTP